MTGSHPPERVTTVDVGRLGLVPGAGAQVEVAVPVDDLVLAGQSYSLRPAAPEVRLDASRSGSGLNLRLRLAAELAGPCQRCLAPALVAVAVDAREFQAAGRPEGAGYDEDLDCAYLSGPRRDRLDIASWVRDAVAEAVPMTVLCREDCRGLCPRCGADRNAGGCTCAPEEGDPRWAALAELARRLGPG